MNNVFYVYIYLDPRKPGSYQYGDYLFDYEPFYVGKGKGRRIRDHRSDKSDTYKVKRIQKILREGFELIYFKVQEELIECQSFRLEMELIKTIGRYGLGTGPLTNLTDGGEGASGHITSVETKKKISESELGEKHPMFGRHHSEETKRMISESNKGKMSGDKHPLFGKHHSEESKKKNSESHKGRIVSVITRKKLSIAFSGDKHPLFGKHPTQQTRDQKSVSMKIAWKNQKSDLNKPISEETRKKLSDSNIGEKNPNYGKHPSDETKQKMSETKKLYWANKKQKELLENLNQQ